MIDNNNAVLALRTISGDETRARQRLTMGVLARHIFVLRKQETTIDIGQKWGKAMCGAGTTMMVCPC